jgi:long-chain fatty acid transport protein
MKLKLDGDAHFGLPQGFNDFSIFHDQGGAATMWLPDVIAIGLGYDITKDVFIEFDFNYTLWSVYDELPVTFDNDPSGQLSSVSRKDWKNTSTFRLAVSWRVIPALTLRLGGGYDVSPVPDDTLDPMLPDSNRFFGAFGIGYEIQKIHLRFDASYTFVKFLERTVTAKDGNPFPATYNTTAHLVGITAAYTY